MKMVLGLLMACLVALPAYAQSTNSSTNNTNQTTDSSAANNVNVTAVSQGNVGESDIHYSGHTWTTPGVAGSYFGGTNPCLIGTGGGAAGGPIGFSLNFGRSDRDCTRRSDAAAWHALGLDGVAIARMCQDKDPKYPVNADAFYAATGYVCPGADRQRYKLADGSLAPLAVIANVKRVSNEPMPISPPANPTLGPQPQESQPVGVPTPTIPR